MKRKSNTAILHLCVYRLLNDLMYRSTLQEEDFTDLWDYWQVAFGINGSGKWDILMCRVVLSVIKDADVDKPAAKKRLLLMKKIERSFQYRFSHSPDFKTGPYTAAAMWRDIEIYINHKSQSLKKSL